MRVGGESNLIQYLNEIVLTQNDRFYAVVENSFENEEVLCNYIKPVILTQYDFVVILAQARFPADAHRYLHSRMITNSSADLSSTTNRQNKLALSCHPKSPDIR